MNEDGYTPRSARVDWEEFRAQLIEERAVAMAVRRAERWFELAESVGYEPMLKIADPKAY